MKRNLITAIVASAAMAATLVGCATTPAHEKFWQSTEHYVYKGVHASPTVGPYDVKIWPFLSMPDQVRTLAGRPHAQPLKANINDPQYGGTDIAMSAISAPTGISQLGAVGIVSMFALASAECGSRCDIEGGAINIAFVPKSEAHSPEEAYAYYMKGMEQYYRDLSAAGVIGPVVSIGVDSDGVFGVHTKDTLSSLDGKTSRTGVPAWNVTAANIESAKIAIIDVIAPKELGGYPAYLIQSGASGAGLVKLDGEKLFVSPYADFAMMEKRASLTPTWMAWYFPPFHVTAKRTDGTHLYTVPTAILNGKLGFYEPPKS